LIEKIGKYTIAEKIGVGGFGQVYKGKDPYIKRIVAIKTCQSEDEEIKKRFFKEAEFAGNLHHRNIVTIYDFGVEDGIPYIVQEYLTGEDLDRKIKRKEALPMDRKVHILIQVCDALDYAHQAGIIHRDIKPANIRIMEDGTSKMMDFGIAKSLNMESTLTQTGITLGTAAYLAPEQIKGDPIDQRTDIFSLGVMMYELFAYDRPFKGEHISTVLYRILHEDAPDLSTLDATLPPRISEIVRKSMEKDPSLRYNSVAEIRNDLASVFQELGGTLESATQFVPTGSPATGFVATTRGGELPTPEEERTRTTPSGIPKQRPPAPTAQTTAISATVSPEEPVEKTLRTSRPADAVLKKTTSFPTAEPKTEPPRSRFGNPLVVLLFLGLLAGLGWLGWKQLGSEKEKPLIGRTSPQDTALPHPVSSAVSGAPAAPTAVPPVPPGPGSVDPSETERARREKEKEKEKEQRDREAAASRPQPVTVAANFPAKVIVDGKSLGDPAPQFQLSLAPGKHEIRYVIEGYKEAKQTVEVKAGGGNNFQYQFPDWGKLTVQHSPGSPAGEIAIDGEAKGKTPLVDLKISAGSHDVVVTKDGFESSRQTLTVEPRRTTTVTVSLKKAGSG